jgi:cytochrome c peroxidase
LTHNSKIINIVPLHEKNKIFFSFALFLASCSNSSDTADYVTIDPYPNVTNTFSGKIDLNKLQNYANQTVPAYITKDNTVGNVITDKNIRSCFIL